MKRILLALLGACSMIAMTSAAAQEVTGDWVGPLDVAPGTRLPLRVHIQRNDAGALKGTMDSPAQGIQGLPMAAISVEAGSLSFTVPSIGGSYKAQWNEAAKGWIGEWSQAGQRWPLAFRTPPPPSPLPADWQIPSDIDIAKLIADRNAPRAGQGMVIGVLTPEGQRIVAGGTGAGASVDRDSLFEIGSISKVFTALILADMVNKGEVSLDDPAAKYLPRGYRMPERSGHQITLRDLSMHRSGLPRMADNMGAINAVEGPFQDYNEAKLLAFLDRHELTRDPGSQWEYSNLGVGLLGYLLGRAARADYDTLLRQRITGPLGMHDTLITLKGPDASRLVPPFDTYMQPTRPWDLAVLAGAGGIRSSAADMLIFAKAVLDPESKIAAAVKTTLSTRVAGSSPESSQALGWEVARLAPDRELLVHGGQTGGYRAMLALEPAKGRAVVAFSNSAAEPSTVDLALHVLIGGKVAPTPTVPPAPAPQKQRTEIVLPAAELEKFVGSYDLGSGIVIAITRNAGTLYAQREGIPGAPVLPLAAESTLAFFWKAVDAQIRFTIDASGAVTGAELKQDGATFTGTRLKPR